MRQIHWYAFVGMLICLANFVGYLYYQVKTSHTDKVPQCDPIAQPPHPPFLLPAHHEYSSTPSSARPPARPP